MHERLCHSTIRLSIKSCGSKGEYYEETNRKFQLLLFLATIGLGPSLTWATKDNPREAAALCQVRVTLSQAVDSALATVTDEIISAELNVSGKAPVYLVEVMDMGRVHKLSLDARDGTVLAEKVSDEGEEITQGRLITFDPGVAAPVLALQSSFKPTM